MHAAGFLPERFLGVSFGSVGWQKTCFSLCEYGYRCRLLLEVYTVDRCDVYARCLTDSEQTRSGTSHVDEPWGQRSEASPESLPASRWTHNPRR